MDFYFDEIDSTNAWMKDRGETLDGFAIVRAGHQTAGRGQRGNRWASSAGDNLLMSMMFRPERLHARNQFHISEMASLAVWRVVKEILPAENRVEIKWPNDIYVDERKVCGMLIENTIDKDGMVNHSIIGIGLNLNQSTFPEDAPNPASLRHFLPAASPRLMPGTVGEAVRDAFRTIYGDYALGGHTVIHDDYLRALRGRGKYLKYVVLQPSAAPAPTALHDAQGREIIEAAIEDVAPDGRLDMSLRDGSRRSFYFKEITPLLG